MWYSPINFIMFYMVPLLVVQDWKGYILKIQGGQDKQGFPMKQGVLVPGRVQVLMKPGDQCFRGYGRRKGERRRKSVRGCIVSPDLSVLNLVIVKIGTCDALRLDYSDACACIYSQRPVHASLSRQTWTGSIECWLLG